MNTPNYRVKFYMNGNLITFRDYVSLSIAKEVCKRWVSKRAIVELIKLEEKVLNTYKGDE